MRERKGWEAKKGRIIKCNDDILNDRARDKKKESYYILRIIAMGINISIDSIVTTRTQNKTSVIKIKNKKN